MTEAKAMKAATKLVLLTGATGGIGKAIALGCLKQPDVTLIAPTRSESKSKALVAELKKAYPQNTNVISPVFDLASLSSIAAFTSAFKKEHSKLDVLINNAAVVPSTRETTADGIEAQFGVNVVSYVALISQLADILKGGRVVNVASNYAGDLRLDDLQFTKRTYEENAAYRQSKQADRMISWHAAKLYPDFTVNACHPGVVTTNLLQNLGMSSGWESAAKGAETPLFLAFDSSVAQNTGMFWDKKAAKACPWAKGTSDNEKLWKYCTDLIAAAAAKAKEGAAESKSS